MPETLVRDRVHLPGQAWLERAVRLDSRRRARCPKHPHYTSYTFEGVNAGGWLFSCSGLMNRGHYFTATPPSGEPGGAKTL
jgi:hypothetical protein